MDNQVKAELTGPKERSNITTYLIINNIPYQIVDECYRIDLNDITSKQMNELLKIDLGKDE